MLKLVVLVAIAVIAVPLAGGIMVRCDGSLDAALVRVKACAPAADALGADISPSFVGISCGSSDTSGAFGQSTWETPVVGTRARGTLHYAAEKRATDWHVLAAAVSVDGHTIPVVPCGAATTPSGVDADGLACDQGDGAACNRLGVAAARGAGGKKNLEAARGYYERACEAGDGTGCANLGALHERDYGDDKAAVHYYRLGCDKRSPAACTGLAVMLAAGRAIKADPAQARTLWEQACQAGHAPACGQLGALLSRGADAGGRPRELLQRACDADDEASCGELGALYAEGRGVPRDEARAIQIWLGLCDRGVAAGCTNLGRHYRQRALPDEARRYLDRGCAAGDPGACTEAKRL